MPYDIHLHSVNNSASVSYRGQKLLLWGTQTVLSMVSDPPSSNSWSVGAAGTVLNFDPVTGGPVAPGSSMDIYATVAASSAMIRAWQWYTAAGGLVGVSLVGDPCAGDVLEGDAFIPPHGFPRPLGGAPSFGMSGEIRASVPDPDGKFSAEWSMSNLLETDDKTKFRLISSLEFYYYQQIFPRPDLATGMGLLQDPPVPGIATTLPPGSTAVVGHGHGGSSPSGRQHKLARHQFVTYLLTFPTTLDEGQYLIGAVRGVEKSSAADPNPKRFVHQFVIPGFGPLE